MPFVRSNKNLYSFGLLAPDATVTSSYAENPAMGPVFRERLWRFTQKLDRLRPWLAHAFRQSPSGQAYQEEETPISATGSTLLNGQLIMTPDGKLVYNTIGIEHLLRMFAGEPGNYTRYVPASDTVPAPVLKLLRQITGAANGTSNTPPRMRISTAYAFSFWKQNGSSRRMLSPRTPPGS
jgi:hypothetical protein